MPADPKPAPAVEAKPAPSVEVAPAPSVEAKLAPPVEAKPASPIETRPAPTAEAKLAAAQQAAKEASERADAAQLEVAIKRAIAESLGADYVVIGQVQGDSAGVRVLGHLIHLPEQTHVTVSRFDNVSEQSLAKTGEIAGQMSENFSRRLKLRQSRQRASS
jgi:hypothetical protein